MEFCFINVCIGCVPMPCYCCCCPDEGLITEEYTFLYPVIWTPCILCCIDALDWIGLDWIGLSATSFRKVALTSYGR